MLITGLEDDAIREIANHIQDPTDFANFRATSKVIADATRYTGNIDERQFKYSHWTGIPYHYATKFISLTVNGTRWFNFRHGQCKITFVYEHYEKIIEVYIFETYHLGKLKFSKDATGKLLFEQKQRYSFVYRTLTYRFYDYCPTENGLLTYVINVIGKSGYVYVCDTTIDSLPSYTIIDSHILTGIERHMIYYQGGCTIIRYDEKGQKTYESNMNRNGTYGVWRIYIDGKLHYMLKKSRESQEQALYNTKTGQIIAHKLIYKGVIVKTCGSMILLPKV
jgi:hypothetical protein